MSENSKSPKIAREHDPSILLYAADATIAREYDASHADSPLFDTDMQFLNEHIPSGARVLDLGCGTGRALLHLARRDCICTGVDLSEPMLHLAEKKLDQHGYSARLLRMDICELEGLEDNSFDAAICMFSTIGLLRGKRLRMRALREWRRVIKPKGKLIVHAHNIWQNLFWPDGRRWLFWNFLRSILPGVEFGDKWMDEYLGLDKLFIHVFRTGEIKSLLCRAGFVIDDFMPLNITRSERYVGKRAWLNCNGFLVGCHPRG